MTWLPDGSFETWSAFGDAGSYGISGPKMERCEWLGFGKEQRLQIYCRECCLSSVDGGHENRAQARILRQVGPGIAQPRG